MIRFCQIMVLLCTAVLLTGCNAPEKEKPIWEQVKISDLYPPSEANTTPSRVLKTIGLDIHIFEMPAEDFNALDDFWQMMYTKPLRFNNYDAFKANSFALGFGQLPMWDIIANVLRNAGGKKLETVSLLLPAGETEDFTITRLTKEQTVFYISDAGSMEGVTVGPGRLALRIKVDKIPGSRGVCTVSAQPVFTLPKVSRIPQLEKQEKANEVLFTSAGFAMKMSPDDFVLLGPEKYLGHQITLGSLLFSSPKPKPTVRLFLIICSRIID